jgi:hypothetical protein
MSDTIKAIRPDREWVWAIAIVCAMRGDTTLIEELRREQIEIWNGDGI